MIPELGPPRDVVENADGVAQVWRPHPWLFVTRVTGRMNSEHAERIIAVGNMVVMDAPKKAVALHDWWGVQSYEVAVQARMSAWTVRVINSMHRVVFAVDAPLVSLAVRTVNLAIGNRFEFLRDSEELGQATRSLLN